MKPIEPSVCATATSIDCGGIFVDLLLLRPAILRTQQRVAAEGDDRQFAFCFAARRAQSEILALERHGHATRSAASP